MHPYAGMPRTQSSEEEWEEVRMKQSKTQVLMGKLYLEHSNAIMDDRSRRV